MRNFIPWIMTLGRVVFAPLVIWLGLRVRDGRMIAACIIAEILLDIFDGMVARRLGVATPLLRRVDSLVDTVFFVAVLYVAWKLHSDAIRQRWWIVGILLTLEVARYAIDYIKFGREAAYHMWSSKACGLVMAAAAISLLTFNYSSWLLTAALVVGILNDTEGLIISLLLHKSVEDVPHLMRAVALRREQEMRARSHQFSTMMK